MSWGLAVARRARTSVSRMAAGAKFCFSVERVGPRV